METFDSMLPLEEGTVEKVPTQVPETVEAVCAALAGQAAISSVNLGRQVTIPFACCNSFGSSLRDEHLSLIV